jgi:hypothetical protein
MSETISRIPFAGLPATLKGYKAERHLYVSTEKGAVFFSRPLKKWILVQKQGNTAVLRFSDDCPCSRMGELY